VLFLIQLHPSLIPGISLSSHCLLSTGVVAVSRVRGKILEREIDRCHSFFLGNKVLLRCVDELGQGMAESVSSRSHCAKVRCSSPSTAIPLMLHFLGFDCL
jgi:hypothetical protein